MISNEGIEDKIYTGKALKQELAVAVDDESLEPNKDYIVKYSNNKNVSRETLKG